MGGFHTRILKKEQLNYLSSTIYIYMELGVNMKDTEEKHGSKKYE
jgi:hypothetical protein